jgi:O-antigen/teichoic acid export membrane protein
MGLATKSAGTFISKVVILALRIPIGILVARFLGPEGKGLVYLLIAAINVCASLGSFGLGPASIYYIGKDRKCLPAVVGNLLMVTGATSGVLCIAGWLFLQYGRPEVYANLPIWMWSITALLVPLNLVRGLLRQVLSGTLRIKEVNLLDVATIATHLFLVLTFVVYLKAGIGGALLAVALSESLAAVGFLVIVMHYGGWPTATNLALLKDSIRFGIKTYLENLMKLINFRLDAFLVASLAAGGIHATGVYSVATGMAELLLFVPQSIRLSLFPMVAASSMVEANRLTSASCRHALLLTAVGALGFGVIGTIMIPYLYGEAFAGAITPLLVLLPGLVMESLVRILYGDLNGRGKPGATAVSTLLTLVVTVALDFVLIPKYGITGAALASSCAYTVEFIITATFFMHYSKLHWKEISMFQRSDFYSYKKILPNCPNFTKQDNQRPVSSHDAIDG